MQREEREGGGSVQRGRERERKRPETIKEMIFAHTPRNVMHSVRGRSRRTYQARTAAETESLESFRQRR